VLYAEGGDDLQASAGDGRRAHQSASFVRLAEGIATTASVSRTHRVVSKKGEVGGTGKSTPGERPARSDTAGTSTGDQPNTRMCSRDFTEGCIWRQRG
jgi:hypothetical protein